MANIFKKLNGVINNVFSIGLKENKTTFTSTENTLSVDKSIDVGTKNVKSSAVPTEADDLTNRKYVVELAAEQQNSTLKVFVVSPSSAESSIQFPDKFGTPDNIYIKTIIVDVINGCDPDTSINILCGDHNLFDSEDLEVDLSTICQYKYSMSFLLEGNSSLQFISSNDSVIDNIRLYIEYASIYN